MASQEPEQVRDRHREANDEGIAGQQCAGVPGMQFMAA